MNMKSIINHTPSSLEVYKPADIKEINCHHTNSEVGDITIVSSGDYILGLGFGFLKPTELVNLKCNYTSKPINIKTPKLKVMGTDFQVRVWKELLKVRTPISYKELAQRIGKPTSYRAVANAVGANPISLLIPCHRIVGHAGIGGYRWGIAQKQRLLEWEHKNGNL